MIKEPATTCFGHLYELEAIKQWVKEKGTCPMTKQRLELNDIYPQYAVKDIIR